MTEPILIKKYANRRLYDTRQSRYITLDELAQIVRGGTDVSVIDAKSGNDLTRQVLIQVLLEEQDRLDMLPPELLHHVIRVQGTAAAGATSSFLSQSTKQFLSLGDQMARTVAPASKAWMELAEAAFRGFTVPPSPRGEPEPEGEPDPEGEDEPAAAPNLAADVAALKDQMAELMKALQGK